MKLEIDPTAMQRQELFEEIVQRNRMRRDAQMPLIDVHTTYVRELAFLRLTKFRHILQPYIDEALSELPAAYGLPGRIGRNLRAERIAYERLIHDYDCDLDDLPVPTSVSQRLFRELAKR